MTICSSAVDLLHLVALDDEVAVVGDVPGARCRSCRES